MGPFRAHLGPLGAHFGANVWTILLIFLTTPQPLNPLVFSFWITPNRKSASWVAMPGKHAAGQPRRRVVQKAPPAKTRSQKESENKKNKNMQTMDRMGMRLADTEARLREVVEKTTAEAQRAQETIAELERLRAMSHIGRALMTGW